jgi:hypothetical protein
MVKRLTQLVVALLLTGCLLGCGGDKDKGINTDKDRPKMEDTGK